MWETEWSAPPSGPVLSGGEPSALDRRLVEACYVTVWMEHCVECAIPDCYSLCPLYVRRRDGKCARFRNGIFPNPRFSGLFDYGAEVHFRRWGKLESWLSYGATDVRTIRQYASLDSLALTVVNPVSSLLEPVNPKRRLNGLYRVVRDRAISWHTRREEANASSFDEFVIEVFQPGAEVSGLIIEAHQDSLVFRDSVPLRPGWNLHAIPFRKMSLDLARREGRILVYPEQDAELRLVFTWLDFVRYAPGVDSLVPTRGRSDGRKGDSAPQTTATAPKPAEKVKCVAWDLDNTLWKGILIEDGPAALVPNPEALDLIRTLDERGILNTIVSKNDHAQAWGKIQELGLDPYFLSPAINWGRKSENLKAVADSLNINIDTFALIDDSPFERGEVSSELPQVRV